MLYRFLRAVLGFFVQAFFRIAPLEGNLAGLLGSGPVIFVANHPNSLVDPGILFVVLDRQLTFLAKAPLFSMPVIGALLRGLGALPVYRKQDDPSQMAKNDGTINAASEALVRGGAITLFPEGKSHSEPQLSGIKTGCARIALEAHRQGAALRIVPMGLNYESKHRFRSLVHVAVGEVIQVSAYESGRGAEDSESVRKLTQEIADKLRAVTLNVEQWDDVPLLKTAEALYALHTEQASAPERVRLFARGMALLRQEDPERFADLKERVSAFQGRLSLVDLSPQDIAVRYQTWPVLMFILRNLFWVFIGTPLFVLGFVLFAPLYPVPRITARIAAAEFDTVSTVKLLTFIVMVPAWWLILTIVAWAVGGLGAMVAALFGLPLLAIFTINWFENRKEAVHDALTFLFLARKSHLRTRLKAQAASIASDLETVAAELKPRLVEP